MGEVRTRDMWLRPDGRTVRYYRLDEPLPDKRPLAVVTGADTYVGQALVESLHAHEQSVAALSAGPVPLAVPRFLGTAGFGPAWEALLATHEVHTVYHCTRLPAPGICRRPTRTQEAEAWEVHVADTLALLRRWDDQPPAVVLLSSAAVYGGGRPHPAAEDQSLAPDSPWADSLAAAEALVATLAPRHVILRLFEAVGPDSAGRVADSPDAPWAQMARGQPVEAVPARTDFVALDAVADALGRAGRHLAEGGGSLTLNLGTGRSTDPTALAAAFGAPVPSALANKGLVADISRLQQAWGWVPPAPPLPALARASRAALAGEPRAHD